MKIKRRFTKPNTDVFSTVKWSKRTSRISNSDGSVVFEMKDAEVPENWSQLATDIMVSKYFRKAGVPQEQGAEASPDRKGAGLDGQGGKSPVNANDSSKPSPQPSPEGRGSEATGPEKSARQVIHRLAGCWRHWGETHGYFDTAEDAQAFYDELCHMMLHQMAAPNSPQWFNTGLNWAYGITGPAQGHFIVDPGTGEVKLADDAYTHPQPHACVAGDTLVLTSEGWLRVREIVERDRTDLRIFDGQCWTGIRATKHNGTRRLHRMMLANGQYADVTDDHLILASHKRGRDGGTYEWTPAGECLGHKVLYALNEDQMSEEATARRQRLALHTAELVGFHVGDGYARTYEGIARFGVCTATKEEFERVAGLFEAQFGAFTVTAKPEVSPEYRIIRHDFTETIEFREAFDLGVGSANVRVPDRIFRASAQAQRAFLRGLFQADGAVRIRRGQGRNSGDIVLATISEQLAHEVQTLLSGLGIYARRIECRDSRPDRATLHHVIIAYASERAKFEQQIGFVDSAKSARLRELNRRVRGKRKPTVSEETVVSWRDLGEAEVYDIQTGTGRFAANGIVVHNCFIQSVSDDLVNSGGIMDLWVREARLFKYGSGTGTNFSGLRGEGEPLSGGGTSSGLMSWLKIGDRAAAAIKSGGTTRRAAKMVCLDLDHPDIEAFVNWKVREELKVAAMVEGLKTLPKDQQKIAADLGLKLDYDFNGEAYYTVSGQNSNNSVRIPDAFFDALDKGEPWNLYQRTTGDVHHSIESKKLWEEICYAAWRCADPGVQFDSTINAWHTCPESGRINASNPCSEYMFLDNTACNLASINLLRFYDAKNATFDIDAYEHAIRLWTIVLEISVLMAAFPSEEIARLSYDFRTLGLGFANIGAMLMQAGIAYDSEEARALCGCLTAILTGRSYAVSAEMAGQLGPFPGFAKNREPMLRVMRNHRRAAHGIARDSGQYEHLRIAPVPIDPEATQRAGDRFASADALLQRARRAWDEALDLGEKHGYRNAQVTVIAPTGTIGLLMDCDTTGVEPDFALVKFKKLAGGGYFKIANNSLRPALETLGYREQQVRDIIRYVMGSLSLDVPMPGSEGGTFEAYLAKKGFTEDDLAAIEAQLGSVFEIGIAFSAWSMREDLLRQLGIDVEKARSNPSFSLLREIGLSAGQIDSLNEMICGTQTIEGAPHLRDEHLPVFDCANPCGRKGKRFIAPEGHIRMMAASQPFISGAISKTINLPNSATVADIAACYRLSWELGLKANALYRDGCKLSQPLSTRSDAAAEALEAGDEDELDLDAAKKEVAHDVSAVAAIAAAADGDSVRTVEKIVERIVERPLRRRLADTRRSITHKFNVAGHEGYLTVGLYEDGMPGELFLTMSKEGSTIGGLMDSLGTAISVALQYGVPLESLVGKFTHQRFEPAGMTTNADIPFAKSLVDYIFRWMGIQFISGYRSQAAPQRGEGDGAGPPPRPAPDIFGREAPPAAAHGGLRAEAAPANEDARLSAVVEREHASFTLTETRTRSRTVLDRAMGELMGDAPVCDVCGALTVRNGTCYKCMNCGNSMGCS